MPQSRSVVMLNLCYLSTIFLNLMNYAHSIPIYFQLFISSLTCLYIGSRRGIIIQEKIEKEDKERPEKMSAKDAYLFPIYGSIVLVALYFVYKVFNKNLLNSVLNVHFTIFGFLSLVQLLSYHLEKIFPDWGRTYVFKKRFDINLKIYKRTFDSSVNRCEVVAGLIALPPTIGYFISKHWLLNNLFGISFSICGIESLVLPTFKVAFILLWGLFFYDIFWVYGTDVMTTVANSVDAPIKLFFPKDLSAVPPSFSMLGLGDIVIPGVFIALCLKYDVDKAILNLRKQGIKEFDYDTITTPYFHSSLVGYAVGIALTFNALVFFDHPQPALLFLVPCCCLSVLLCALKKREFKHIFNYDEEQIRFLSAGYTPLESSKEK